MRSALPGNVAVSECAPTGSALTGSVAEPATSGAVPRLVVPDQNVTAPVGMATDGATGVTTATSGTGWPVTEVPGAFSAVAVAPGVTVWARGVDALATKLPSSGT